MAISKTQALLQQKCPRCREGNLFEHSIYNLTGYNKMHTNCPVCSFHFEVEPGFFWGGMYFSYALNVMQSVLLGFATYILFDNPSAWVYLTILIGAIFLFTPLNFRLARVMMLYLFAPVHFDPSYSNSKH